MIKLHWPFNRKPKYVAPWWNGYIDFPNTNGRDICIVMRNGVIVRLNNEKLTLILENNHGTYINTKVLDMSLRGFE